jgi:hypothetical protein
MTHTRNPLPDELETLAGALRVASLRQPNPFGSVRRCAEHLTLTWAQWQALIVARDPKGRAIRFDLPMFWGATP